MSIKLRNLNLLTILHMFHKYEWFYNYERSPKRSITYTNVKLDSVMPSINIVIELFITFIILIFEENIE